MFEAILNALSDVVVVVDTSASGDEAERQLRGESPNPVPDARVSLVTGGATTGLPSCALFGRTI